MGCTWARLGVQLGNFRQIVLGEPHLRTHSRFIGDDHHGSPCNAAELPNPCLLMAKVLRTPRHFTGKKLVIASHNKGKLKEMVELMAQPRVSAAGQSVAGRCRTM